MRWKELTYRTRLRILPVIFLLGFVLIYWLAIGKTVDLVTQVDRLESQVEQISDAPLRIQILKKRLAQLKNSIGDYQDEISHEHIFEDLSTYCKSNRLTIREYPEVHQTESNGHWVNTFQLEVEGGFHSLLKLVHSLEQKAFLGKLAGVKFQLKTNRRSRTEYLSVRIYLQTVN